MTRAGSASAASVARAAARPWRRWLLDGLVGLALPLLVGLSQAHLWRPAPAAVYNWAADEMLAGRFGPRLYDDSYALQATLGYNHGQGQDILSPTPPILVFFIAPARWLPEGVLRVLWLGLDIAVPFLAVWLTFRAVSLPSLALAGACTALLLLSGPLWENNLRGQVLHWQMLLCALALYSLARGRQGLAGASLGFMFLLKLAGWPVWLMLAQRRHWRALAAIGLSAAALAAVSLPWVRLDTWLFYLTSVLPRWAQTPIAVVPAYQTVAGFWQHLLRYDATFNPAPLLNLPWLATALSIVSTLALLGLTLFGMRRAPLLLAAGAGLILTVLLAPIAEQYHYLTAAPALIVAAVEWHRHGHRPALGLLLLASAWLMFWPINYKDPRLAAGWLALLAYPRLWGGLLLWGGGLALALLHTQYGPLTLYRRAA